MYALILAGGRGERLWPLTEEIPKPMVEVLGKPILWHQLTWLRSYGVTHVVLLVHHRWEHIRQYFGDGEALGLQVCYSVEETPLGRGGALRRGLSLVPQEEERVLATNGDVITDADLGAMLHEHRSGRFLATLLMVPYHSQRGIVDVDPQGRVTGFREKAQLPYWINGGVYVLERSLESLLPERGDHELTLFPELARQGQLGGYQHRGLWQAIDSKKDLTEVETALRTLGGQG